MTTSALVLPLMLMAALASQADRAVEISVPRSESFAREWSTTDFDHDLWDAALKDHVDSAGLVNYDAICRDPHFLEYLHRLANTPPDKLADAAARQAFWINAYNALAVQGVCHARPAEGDGRTTFSVIDYRLPGVEGKAFFTGLRFQVGGRRHTLDEIEKGMLFRRPEVTEAEPAHYAAAGVARPDTRVHFALVCGARGCPPLGRAYRVATLNDQLESAAEAFVRAHPKAHFDAKNRVATLSPIFEWYAADFTNRAFERSAPSVIAYVAEFIGTGRLGQALRDGRWTLRYGSYDWSLNESR